MKRSHGFTFPTAPSPTTTALTVFEGIPKAELSSGKLQVGEKSVALAVFFLPFRILLGGIIIGNNWQRADSVLNYFPNNFKNNFINNFCPLRKPSDSSLQT